MDQDDATLVRAARAGDRAAYAELFTRHREPARRYAYSLVGDDSRADDLVSDAFVKVLIRLDNGAGPTGSFRGYLFSTIRNAMIDHTRRDRREHVQADLSEEADAPELEVAETFVETTIVMRALMRLPVRWRNALWYSEVLKESHEDIAARFGIRTNAVGVLCYRAREGLRQAYLAEHIGRAPSPECARFSDTIPAYVRGHLAPRKAGHLRAHLATCAYCTAAVDELSQVNVHLGALVGPAILLAATARGGVREWLAAHAAAAKAVLVATAVSVAVAGALVTLTGEPDRPSPPHGARPTLTATASPPPPPTVRPVPVPTSVPTTLPPPGSQEAVVPASLTVSEPWTATAHANEASIATVGLSAATTHGPLRLSLDLANVTDAKVTTGDWSCRNAVRAGSSIRLTCVSVGDVGDGVTFGVSARGADDGASVTGSVRISDARTSLVRPFTIGG